MGALPLSPIRVAAASRMGSGEMGAYRELEGRFAAAAKLGSVRALLWWDSQTYMPAGGAATRAEQMAAVETLAGDMLADPVVGEWIAGAEAEALGPEETANLAEMRRIFRHASAVPTALKAERARAAVRLQRARMEARERKDFSVFAPGFSEMMRLIGEIAAAKAEALGLSGYDALMDEADPGILTEMLEPLFAELEAFLPPLLGEVREVQARAGEPQPLDGDFSTERQLQLAVRLMGLVGLDAGHSRIDVAPHPFTLASNPGDVRITTRVDPGNVRFSALATLHEAGHALYERNLPARFAFQPAGAARGATPHESQSLMLEMYAGRSAPFLAYLAPVMRDVFSGSAEAWTAENLTAHYRRIGKGNIRVEADELSYPLHIILRYRIERALLSGDLAMADVPGAWTELSHKLFGYAPPDDAQGALQDIHWSLGMFGYFPNYALGAMLAAQLFEAATQADPDIVSGLGRGDFSPFRQWVRTAVHERGSLISFETLVRESTGRSLGAEALKRHLRRRYLDEAAC